MLIDAIEALMGFAAVYVWLGVAVRLEQLNRAQGILSDANVLLSRASKAIDDVYDRQRRLVVTLVQRDSKTEMRAVVRCDGRPGKFVWDAGRQRWRQAENGWPAEPHVDRYLKRFAEILGDKMEYRMDSMDEKHLWGIDNAN